MSGIRPPDGLLNSSTVPSSPTSASGKEVKLKKPPSLLQRLVNLFGGKQLEKATGAVFQPAPEKVPTQKSFFAFLSGLFNIQHRETEEDRNTTAFINQDRSNSQPPIVELGAYELPTTPTTWFWEKTAPTPSPTESNKTEGLDI
jgi:hypothetical protein